MLFVTYVKLGNLRCFAHWLENEGLTEEYTAKGVKMAKLDENPRIVREEDIKLALRYLRKQSRREKDFFSIRDRTIILFLAGTGLRASEMCRLDWQDIDYSSGLIRPRQESSALYRCLTA
ncbi:tyrosine-type recombinase/integrase [Sporolactobacillus shoreicorticis]|uniref:Tyrosine-type recombinase/integrase n=1 Tax=Sporolactobacillus shoreicorticis TaxID=1923877 RepID=A0ABW5S7B4_9BACL|nr:tyrosine-type recombinase/integrase [Sporolactobacillus shoreicorticis]MCO7126894.1 tyrosine-type recombinase/integrase [Sporolactobacillus shoreicorticis]